MPNNKRTARILNVTRGKNSGQFRFVLYRGVEPIAQSHPETYTAKAMCRKTLRNNFPDFEIVDETA